MPPIRGKSSAVWNHFTQEVNEKAKCGHCSLLLSYAGGSISNLKRHLVTKHATIPLDRTAHNTNNIDNGKMYLFYYFY